MKKRMIVVVLAIVGFVAVIGAVKYRQIRKGMAQQANFQGGSGDERQGRVVHGCLGTAWAVPSP